MQSSRRRLALLMLVLALCLTGCMIPEPVKLDSWKDFQKEMRNQYDCIRKVGGEQYYPYLNINIYYSGEPSEETKTEILDTAQEFLSDEAFREEFVAYGRAEAERTVDINGYIADMEANMVEIVDGYVPLPMPDINVFLIRYGSDEREMGRSAGYYVESFRSDRKMEIDNYQTWYNWGE